MKLEAQNIALAQLMGWKCATEALTPIWWEAPNGLPSIGVPDYTKSLDLILVFVREKIEGDDSLESKFLRRLSVILDRRADDETRCICDMDLALITCSADEYCEAALVALGKWVEDEAATGKEGK